MSKTTRVIFYLSSLYPLPSFPSTPCRAVHFPGHVYRNLFLLFLFPNDPPNANGITTHPRFHDSFYIHDEMLAHSKARGLNVRFSCSRSREIHADCFSENSRARCEIVTLKTGACFYRSAIPIKIPNRDIADKRKISIVRLIT